jgi:dienelactone hydrolase
MATTVLYPASGPPGTAPTPNAPPAAADRRYPLLVFAHGFDATPALYASLLSRWASAGYVVVAPTVPLLNADAPGGPSHTDFGVPNISDLDFALSEALRRSATPGDPIAGLVDPNRIAVAGHSDGEVLAYAIAFEGCCHDRRVKAVIPMAGNLANAEAAPSATGPRRGVTRSRLLSPATQRSPRTQETLGAPRREPQNETPLTARSTQETTGHDNRSRAHNRRSVRSLGPRSSDHRS